MFSLPIPLLIILSVIASALIGILRGKYAKSYPMSGVYLWRFNFYQNIFCFYTVDISFFGNRVQFQRVFRAARRGACRRQYFEP